MTKRIKHWQRIIEEVLVVYTRLDHSCDAAISAGAMDSNGPLFDAIWRGFETMLKHIDHDGWIRWYIYDNDCGEKSFAAKCSGMRKAVPIRTASDLAKLIAKSEAQ